MESLGMPELLVILGVAVLLFGGKKIPELAKGLGEGIRNFKNALKSEPEKPDEPEKPVARVEAKVVVEPKVVV
jgi:sec-independent protein translocase protein TatA